MQPATEAIPAAPPAGDLEVISLVGLAHGTSHFFHLLLAPLFPWLMRDFGLSFVRVGSLVTAFFVVSGVGQAAAGFVVDRLGARRVLLAGIGLFGVASVTLALASGYPALLAAAILAGAGNSVFHPADFTILNRSVSPPRLGIAFSVHGLSGNLGWAAAPVFLTFLAGTGGWRAAAFGAALVAAGSLAVLLLRGAAMSRALPSPAGAGPEPVGTTFGFLATPAVWMCFAFFLLATMAFGGVQSFGSPVLQQVYGLSLESGASALTVYLLGGAAGVAVGGWMATRFPAHERVVAVVLGLAALSAVALASGAFPPGAVVPLLAAVGFLTGSAGPSRDLLVRRASMERFGQRSFGRIYGFVYSGLDVGLSAAPLVFGAFMDRGQPRWVLGGVALLQILAVLTALRVGASAPPRRTARA
ncbi:MAG: MFS transporter [Deltaproteobacteria bacterium]|nr:MFS transporter [Deltaproteobacteria bacterium]